MIDGLKIVIAEENALLGTDLAEHLGELGHHVCAMIATEAEAVAAAVRCSPDMMIVDTDLAEGNGLDAMHQILEIGPMPHFFVADDLRDVLSTVPDAVVLLKPVDLHELESGIAAVCSQVCLHGGRTIPHLPTGTFSTDFQRV